MEVPDEALAWAAELALELRRRVKEQQAHIGAAEFGKTDLSYRVGGGAEKCRVLRRVTPTPLERAKAESAAAGARAVKRSGVLPEPDRER